MTHVLLISLLLLVSCYRSQSGPCEPVCSGNEVCVGGSCKTETFLLERILRDSHLVADFRGKDCCKGNVVDSSVRDCRTYVECEDGRFSVIFIQFSSLYELPESIGEFTSLKKLLLNGNQLTHLPTSIFRPLLKLESINLVGNAIPEILPDALFSENFLKDDASRMEFFPQLVDVRCPEDGIDSDPSPKVIKILERTFGAEADPQKCDCLSKCDSLNPEFWDPVEVSIDLEDIKECSTGLIQCPRCSGLSVINSCVQVDSESSFAEDATITNSTMQFLVNDNDIGIHSLGSIVLENVIIEVQLHKAVTEKSTLLTLMSSADRVSLKNCEVNVTLQGSESLQQLHQGVHYSMTPDEGSHKVFEIHFTHPDSDDSGSGNGDDSDSGSDNSEDACDADHCKSVCNDMAANGSECETACNTAVSSGCTFNKTCICAPSVTPPKGSTASDLRSVGLNTSWVIATVVLLAVSGLVYMLCFRKSAQGVVSSGPPTHRPPSDSVPLTEDQVTIEIEQPPASDKTNKKRNRIHKTEISEMLDWDDDDSSEWEDTGAGTAST